MSMASVWLSWPALPHGEFPTEWHQFLPSIALISDETHEGIVQSLRADMTNRFPFQSRKTSIGINSAYLFLKLKDGFEQSYDDASPLVFGLVKLSDGGNERPRC